VSRRSTQRALAALAVLPVAAVPAAGCGIAAGPGPTHRAPAATTIALVDFGIAPAIARVPAGGLVTWKNAGRTEHSVEGRHFFSEALEPQGRYRIRFRHPGTYRYVCTLHPRTMRGRVVVTGPPAT
jgi:plastocyanin